MFKNVNKQMTKGFILDLSFGCHTRDIYSIYTTRNLVQAKPGKNWKGKPHFMEIDCLLRMRVAKEWGRGSLDPHPPSPSSSQVQNLGLKLVLSEGIIAQKKR